MTRYLYLAVGFSIGIGTAIPLSGGITPLGTLLVRVWLASGLFGLLTLPLVIYTALSTTHTPLARPLRISLVAASVMGFLLVYDFAVVWNWPGVGDIYYGRSSLFAVPQPLLAVVRWCSPVLLVPLEAMADTVSRSPRGTPVLLIEYLQGAFDPSHRWWHMWLSATGVLFWGLLALAVLGIRRLMHHRRPPENAARAA